MKEEKLAFEALQVSCRIALVCVGDFRQHEAALKSLETFLISQSESLPLSSY